MADPADARDVETLAAAVAAGARAKYVFFWGHTAKVDGAIGSWVFSQWYPSPFTVDGQLYRTAEHWMMAEKARLFGDETRRAKILEVHGPGDAKAHGRRISGFSEDTWAQRRFEIVVQGNVHKFSQHPALLEFLLGTARRVLVEASPVDRVWGIGLAHDDPRAEDPARWRGLNLLGFALMEARARLP
ncbi:NADAR family protein [Paraliomyxa miuraensis]|uniref:NADAR family protein n=1 Tax=Paraliomyxa miuraensis TaxID=376150 RepID=UPI00224FC65A|nr:NADAR family protein [Paraliomyxa miuraensis]MCX4241373.1 NADAR family protein [Paraliomyxa miuraensis]